MLADDLDLIVLPRRLHLRVVVGPATTCASTARPSRTRSTTTASATRSTRPIPTCRRRTRRARGSSRGTTTRSQNDYADDRSRARSTRASGSCSAAPPPTRPTTSTCRCGAQMVPFGSAHAALSPRVGFGTLVQFHVLDDRQYRSPQPCPPPGRGGAQPSSRTARERLDPRLHDARRRRRSAGSATGLDRSRARWNVIAQQTLMAQLDRKPGRRPAVLDRRLGRLSGGAPPPARLRSASASRAQPGRARRRRALVLGDRPQARLRRPALAGRRDRVRRHVDHVAVRPRARRTLDALLADNPHVRFGERRRVAATCAWRSRRSAARRSARRAQRHPAARRMPTRWRRSWSRTDGRGRCGPERPIAPF